MAVVPLSTYKKSCVPSRSLLLPLPHINRQSLVCTAKKTSTLQKTSCSESAGRKKQRILFFVGAGRRLLVTASSATGLMGRSSPLYDFLVVVKKQLSVCSLQRSFKKQSKYSALHFIARRSSVLVGCPLQAKHQYRKALMFIVWKLKHLTIHSSILQIFFAIDGRSQQLVTRYFLLLQGLFALKKGPYLFGSLSVVVSSLWLAVTKSHNHLLKHASSQQI